MSLVFVVHDIFQVNSRGLFQVLEKALVKNIRDTANLFDSRFRFRVAVYKVHCDGNGQFPSKFFPFEALERVSASIGANDDVELKFANSMVVRLHYRGPASVWNKQLVDAYMIQTRLMFALYTQ